MKYFFPLTKRTRLPSMEFIIVSFIIIILFFVAINHAVQNAATVAHDSNKRIINATVMQYLAAEGVPEKNGALKIDWKEALVDKYLEEWPEPPQGYSGAYSATIERRFR